MPGLRTRQCCSFCFTTKLGQTKKSSQNILVISRSFKLLHNFVERGNLSISSFLNGVEKAWSFTCHDFALASWMSVNRILTLLRRDKKDVAITNYSRGCSDNLHGDISFFSSVILILLRNSKTEVRTLYRHFSFQKLVQYHDSNIKCQKNNQEPSGFVFDFPLHFKICLRIFCSKHSPHLLNLEVVSNHFSSS